MKAHLLLASVGVTLMVFTSGFAQVSCPNFDKDIKYKVLFKEVTATESGTELFLRIYIEPSRFNVESIVRLAKRLKMENCGFDSLAVRFYDTERLEKMPDPPPQPLTDWLGTIMRGYYDYDRKESKEGLFFRELRKDKKIDIQITFGSNGYCVLEKKSEDQ